MVFFLLLICSKNVLCKKASISLGIRFDDSKYKELKKHLKTIGKAKELVSTYTYCMALFLYELTEMEHAIKSHLYRFCIW